MRTLRDRDASTVANLDIVLVNDAVMNEALDWISGCESCTDNALIDFDYILDAVTGRDPERTEYIMPVLPQCPHCASKISEKTQIAVNG